MRKVINLTLMLLCILNISAQKKLETKEIKYNNGVYQLEMYDTKTKKLVNSITTGKNVSISYNPSFDDYLVVWEENSERKQLYLIPKETSSKGTVYMIGEEGITEDEQIDYLIKNNINKNGKLLVIFAHPIPYEGKEYTMVQSFEGFN